MAELPPTTASTGAPQEHPITDQQELVAPLPTVPIRGPWHPSTWFTLVRGRPFIPVIVFLTAVFIGLTAIVVRADLQPTPWDIEITAWVQSLPEVTVGAILTRVSDPGYWPWNTVLAVVVAGIMFIWRWLPEAVFTAFAGAGGFLSEFVKNLVDRPRPTPDFARIAAEHTTFSFPSGHVTGYVTLFGFIFYLAYTLLPRKHPARWIILTLCGLLISLVALSRIWMGAHWASDTIAGYALGFAYLLVLIELYRAWQKRHPKASTEYPAASEAVVGNQ
jgi:membrane-associated phospholipid phosphatase